MSRCQSLGDVLLDSQQHSSDARNSMTSSSNNNNGRGHHVTMSESSLPPAVSDAFHVWRGRTNGTAAVGETGTFRARVMARKFINTSNRRLLEKNASVSSMAAAAGTDAMGSSTAGESTPLVGSILEDRSATNLDMMSGSKEADDKPTVEHEMEPVNNNIWKSFLDVWFGKYVSIFLLVTPLALWATFHGWGGAWVFWTNFFVLLPLASILGDFTEEAALHTNETIGGLLNATFGNCVEVIVALQALLRDEIRVVQASMIGSIFSNLLLVLGCCFFFGGCYYKEQTFNVTSATASMGLLALSSLALVLPTPYANYYDVQDEDVLAISRAAAIGLFLMYIQLLFFQLHTHREVFDGSGKGDGEVDDDEEEEVELPGIPMWMSLFGLFVVTLLVAWFSDALVGSIDDFCDETGISRTFVGLIILPIVGNAVEHITAVTVAMKNKMDLSLGVAIGSCTQIALFVVPITVLVGWCTDKPMTLNFPHFEICLYVLSIFTVTIAVGTGRSNWLLGSLLFTTYIMIAIGFWFEKVVDF